MDPRAKLDQLFDESQSLDPDDRMRLIARLWASLPEDYFDEPVSPKPVPPATVSRRPLSWEPVRVESTPVQNDLPQLAVLARDFALNLFRPPATPLKEKIYSAPRRFDLATVFAVTSAYCLLFGMMSYFAFAPAASVIIGGFITLVGLGQAFLYGGQNARVASVVTGIVLCVLWNLTAVAWPPRGTSGDALFFLIPFSGALGAGCGYMAGVLVGGVFLVADKLRTYFTNRTSDSPDHEVDEEESDVDRESHVTT